MREAFLLFMVIVAGTGGELCVCRAMKTAGEVTDFGPASLLRFALRAIRVSWTWIGIGLMALAFFSLLAVLSIEVVTFVVPVTALSYAAGAVGATVFLRERVSAERWIGVLIVSIGVTMVWFSKR
jgi:uncharacterized membrane protein